MNASEIREMEERLENWRLCVRSGLLRHHCGSAEHRYRPGKGEALESRSLPRLIVDEVDGWKVERAWRLLALRWRWLLKLHYVMQLERRSVIRWVMRHADHSIKPWQYQAQLMHAVRQLKKTLDNANSGADNQADNSDAVSKDAWNESPKAALARQYEIYREPAEA